MNSRLRDLREDNNLTQQQIADILHCTQSTYSKYEKFKIQPPTTVLIKLANFYNVSVGYLLGVE